MPYPQPAVGHRCNFCGAYESDGRSLVAGPGVYICNQCVDLAVEALKQKEVASPASR